MRVPEENCNMILLAAVTLVSVAVAGGAALLDTNDKKPVRLSDRTTGAPVSSSDKSVIFVSDQPTVRVVGTPFSPNTNPRER